MPKNVNIKITTTLSTDFYIEVPDDISEEDIKKSAAEQTVFPHNFPQYIINLLKTRMGLNISGIDSMFNAWELDNVQYMIRD